MILSAIVSAFSRSGSLRAAALAACFALTGCSRDAQPTPALPTSKPEARPVVRFDQPPDVTPNNVNVVFFLVDTLRADRMSLYGHNLSTTPTIDEFAAECVVFENAQAPGPWTLPSVPSMLTSTFSCEHGVNIDGQKVPVDLMTLPELLRGVGYHTAQFYANGYASTTTDLHRGYDISQRERFTTGDVVRGWMEQRPADRPFFLYIHNVEPHQPHKIPPRKAREFGPVRRQAPGRIASLRGQYRSLERADWTAGRPLGTTDTTAQQDSLVERLNNWRPDHLALYDAAIKVADQRFGSVLEALREGDLLDRSVLVFLSDHGEEFGEHGAYLHSQSVYEEMIHVPFLIRFPNGEFAGRRIREVVSIIDVMPTLCDYLGRPQLLAQARGKSLMPLIRGERDSDDSKIIVTSIRINSKRYYKPANESRGEINIAMRQGSWKGILNVTPDALELYDLASDPGERNDLANEPEHAERRRAFLEVGRAWYADCLAAHLDAGEGGLDNLNAEQLRQLAALGYIDMPADRSDDENGDSAGAEDSAARSALDEDADTDDPIVDEDEGGDSYLDDDGAVP